MSLLLVPPVNSRGTFTVKDVLKDYIDPNMIFTVQSIRSINELLNEEYDVLNLIYKKIGLTEDDYNNDLEANNPIVILTDDSGDFYYLPASQILSIPKTNGVLFGHRIMTIDYGWIPKDLDISYLQDEIKDLITSLTGLDDINIIEDNIPYDYVATPEEYTTYEAERINKITNNKTCRTLLKETQDKLDNMTLRLSQLVDRLKNIDPNAVTTG